MLGPPVGIHASLNTMLARVQVSLAGDSHEYYPLHAAQVERMPREKTKARLSTMVEQ